MFRTIFTILNIWLVKRIDLENTASVTATAIGKEVVEDGVVVETYGGNVELEALGSSSIVGMSAQAYNELEFDQHTGGKYWVQDDQ